ncbi:hypothetical protein ASZ90_015952 [hydrocarbon metagenome]|uniref:Uncharacterized protein n=1 Tax=hydrocarbon metagenome TaxID=938273 RepID=A0A0W8F0S2_9ZZZZ
MCRKPLSLRAIQDIKYSRENPPAYMGLVYERPKLVDLSS